MEDQAPKYDAKCDMMDLMRAHEIMGDKKRFRAALSAAKTEEKKIKSLGDLRAKYKDVVEENQSSESEEDDEDE